METKSGVKFEVIEGYLGDPEIRMAHPQLGKIRVPAPREIPKTGLINCGLALIKRKMRPVKLDLDSKNRRELEKALVGARQNKKRKKEDVYQTLIQQLPECPKGLDRGRLSKQDIVKIKEEIETLKGKGAGFTDPEDWSIAKGFEVQVRKRLEKLKKECAHRPLKWEDDLTHTRDGRKKVIRTWTCSDCGSHWVQSVDAPLDPEAFWR